MNLLARREQSKQELWEKMSRRFEDAGEEREVAQAVDTALEGLIQDNLQSDERFSEAFVAMRKRQGKGPLRIAQDLRQKGISDLLVSAYLNDSEAFWWDLAREVRERKFGAGAADNLKEKARQVRFLQSRGFTHEQVRAAVEG